MGQLLNGRWVDTAPVDNDADGNFHRHPTVFRHWITSDGSSHNSSEDQFKAEVNRYHLYVSLACPWAHRTTIMRRLKGLEGMIGLSVVNWFLGNQGWSFAEGPCVTGDPIANSSFLYELYSLAQPDYTGKVTVPVLWDKKKATIVSNESSDIIRMLNSSFDALGAKVGDYYPIDMRDDIDALNDRIYPYLNNGVYKAGFAISQAAYDDAVRKVFDTLDWLEGILDKKQWLLGDRLTEADIRLFTTLIRFDLVYYSHFKCNIRRLVDYPNLRNYVRRFYALEGVSETVNVSHIKRHYYESHVSINPSGIVPIGPEIDFG